MKGTKNKISFIPMIIILMLFVQMIIPITIYASPETMVKTTGTMNISLRRNTKNQNQIDVVAMDTTYEIKELKYVKKETGAVDVSYFEESHSDIIDFKIKPASRIETSFELSGYGTYTVYAKNSKGNRFLSSITITNPEDVPNIIVKKKEDQKLTVQVEVKSNKYQIEEIKIARKENMQDTIDFSKEGQKIDFVKSQNVTFTYTATQAGIYVIYAKDSQNNGKKLTTYIYDEFPIQAEVSDVKEGSRTVTIKATDSICDIVKVKVALKADISNIEDFKTKGTELDITKGKSIELNYSAPKDGTYKFYIEDEAGFKKMVEKRIAKDTYVTINIEQAKDNPKKVIITAENKLADIVLMKVKIGDNLTVEDVKQTGTELKITKGNKVTASYEVEQNCTLNVYIKDEENYGAMIRKKITGINNAEDTTPPTVKLIQDTENRKKINVTVSDTESYIRRIKWAKGSQNINYFENSGTQIESDKIGKVIETSFMIDAIGTYTVYAEDNEGNKQVKTIEITTINQEQDVEKPQITYTKKLEENKVKVEINVVDNQSEIKTIKAAGGKQNLQFFETQGQALEIKKDGTKASTSFLAKNNGIYTIYAEDVAGNKQIKEIEVTEIENVEQEDVKKPEITGVENGKTYTDSVTPLAQDEHLKEVILKKDNQVVENYQNGDTISEEGRYELTARDESGNEITVTFTIKKEEKPGDGNQNPDNGENNDGNNNGNHNTGNNNNGNNEDNNTDNNADNNMNNNADNNTNNNGTDHSGNNHSSDNGSQSTILGNGDKDTSTTNQIIPKAGGTGVTLIIAILSLTVFAVISYIRYRKIK